MTIERTKEDVERFHSDMARLYKLKSDKEAERMLESWHDLLEACKAILEFWQYGGPGQPDNPQPLSPWAYLTEEDEPIIDVLKRAVSKAEGKS